MYLVDTDVISERRKGERCNPGVRRFFDVAEREDVALYLSAITIGELRQGVEKVRKRGDESQAHVLEKWLLRVSSTYEGAILAFDGEIAEVWGRLRATGPENPLDKQIAATALMNDLTVVTRNTAHFLTTGARVLDPFVLDAGPEISG